MCLFGHHLRGNPVSLDVAIEASVLSAKIAARGHQSEFIQEVNGMTLLYSEL